MKRRRELRLRPIGSNLLEGRLQPQASFRSAATLLPLASGSIAKIALLGPIDSIAPAQRAAWLRECRRVLAPGGELDPGGPIGDDGISQQAIAAGLTLQGEPSRWRKNRPAIRSGSSPVSVLIPAYNPRFFEDCLRSATEQSHDDLEIVIGDDRRDDAIERLVSPVARRDPRIRYVRHPQRLGGRANYIELFGSARGDYIKFLNDDDLLRPRCVELMARCLDRHPEVTLVTSHRQPIDSEGRPLPDETATRRRFAEDRLVEGSSLAEELLLRQLNFVGEPTTAMFRRADAATNRPHLLSFGGRPGAGNNDVTLWVSLLARGEAIYLARTLSCFRRHEEQWQHTPEGRARSLRGWVQLDEDARLAGLCRRDSPAAARSVTLWPRPWWSTQTGRLVDECDAALLQGDWAAARALLDRAVALGEDDASIDSLRGALLLAIGQPAEAQRCFERATDADEDPVASRVGLARATIEQGAIDRAEELLREALDLDPSFDEARALLAAVVCSRPDVAELCRDRAHGAFDTPVAGADAGSRLAVSGWMLAGPDAGFELPRLELSLDGRPIESRIDRVARPDVAVEHPELARLEPFPGFETTIRTEGLPPGEHELCCVARSARSQVLASTRFHVASGVRPRTSCAASD